MVDFFQNLVFNQISFIIGFIAGALGLWLVIKLSRLLSSNTQRLRQDMLRYVQGLHLASPLFALDEVLTEPRVLTPSPPTEPGQESPPKEVLSQILPYLPDWPELAARYSANTFPLSKALSAGANLILTGSLGSGKTTAHCPCPPHLPDSPQGTASRRINRLFTGIYTCCGFIS